MIGFVADTSALIVVLNVEPDVDLFRQAFQEADAVLISTATIFEASCVVARSRFVDGPGRLSALVESLSPEIVPFDSHQMQVAAEAYSRFGRGSGHPAKLNMGDCFSYALAKSKNLPLLFKGGDFSQTDVAPAMPRN